MDVEIDLPQKAPFEWKRKLIFIAVAAIVAGALIAKVGMRKGKAEEEFVKATNAFIKWDQILDKEDGEFAKLESVIQKHPELRAHYDGPIGQNLLAAKDPVAAEPYVERTLKRTGQPYYSDYARGSLLIGKREFRQALEEAKGLKKRMEEDQGFWAKGKDDSALFAFNLLRIAVLSQQVGDLEGELTTWKEMKRYGGWTEENSGSETIGHAGFKELLHHFSVQETTLLDYMASRIEDISN